MLPFIPLIFVSKYFTSPGPKSLKASSYASIRNSNRLMALFYSSNSEFLLYSIALLIFYMCRGFAVKSP